MFITTIVYLGKNFSGVCINGGVTVFGSRSEFIAKIKEKNPNTVGSYCMIYQEALSSRTLPIAMKHKLATIVRAVNYVKASAVNKKLFTKLFKNMGKSGFLPRYKDKTQERC